VKRITMRLACASILTALVLSGCAGGGNGYDDRIGAYGTGYGSNGNRLFERDDEDRPARRGDAGHADRGKEMNKTQTAENGGRSGMFGTEDEFNGSRDGGGAGWFGAGTFSGRMKDSDKLDDTRNFRIGNGYDGITSDGAGTSDPKGAPVRTGNGGGVELQLGGIRITSGDSASAREAGDGSRVLRVTSPVARKALERLSRSLASGQLSARADVIANDLRIVLKDAR